MTTRSHAGHAVAGVAGLLVLVGCGERAGGPAQSPAARAVTPPPSTPSTHSAVVAGAMPSATGGVAAVSVARAFTTEICPYSYADPLPYGQRLNTALTRWGTTEFAAAHRWSPARIATATAGLVEHRAQQACGQITGGIDPETATGAPGQVVVRLSVTVTARSATGPASAAQQIFTFRLTRAGVRWLIEDGQW